MKKKHKRAKINNISRKELIKVLTDKGYRYVRSKGDHDMYSNGKHLIAVPVRMYKWLALRILSQCNISLEEVFTCV